MITQDDLMRIALTLASIREDNQISITIRRDGSADLTPQLVRIVYIGGYPSAQRSTDSEVKETRGGYLLSGPTTLDVQPEDRFNAAGKLWRVVSMRPDQRVQTEALIEVVQ